MQHRIGLALPGQKPRQQQQSKEILFCGVGWGRKYEEFIACLQQAQEHFFWGFGTVLNLRC